MSIFVYSQCSPCSIDYFKLVGRLKKPAFFFSFNWLLKIFIFVTYISVAPIEVNLIYLYQFSIRLRCGEVPEMVNGIHWECSVLRHTGVRASSSPLLFIFTHSACNKSTQPRSLNGSFCFQYLIVEGCHPKRLLLTAPAVYNASAVEGSDGRQT